MKILPKIGRLLFTLGLITVIYDATGKGIYPITTTVGGYLMGLGSILSIDD